MERITFQKTKRIPDLESKKGERTFLVFNILLFVGIIIIVSTISYVLINLKQSDRIFLRCLPIIALGLVLILFYAIGYHKLIAKEKRNRPYRMQFLEKFRLK
jgi:hypothetical protein